MKSEKFSCDKQKKMVSEVGGCAYLNPQMCNLFSTCHMRFVLAAREAGNAQGRLDFKDTIIH